MDPLLKLGRQPAEVLSPERPSFGWRFSAVISAITLLSRWTSASRRCSWSLGRPLRSSNTRAADPSNCFFQA
ncbi:hypothetical protein [Tautonia plasticadhaerens]|uniref:hypothetical protein n=1 Tax=Tautonia plasticadhaerens TaxID=2527974 RepID=UPI001E2A8D66|nr:hypothetical protein [Tautonia plasticadhaerens]